MLINLLADQARQQLQDPIAPPLRRVTAVLYWYARLAAMLLGVLAVIRILFWVLYLLRIVDAPVFSSPLFFWLTSLEPVVLLVVMADLLVIGQWLRQRPIRNYGPWLFMFVMVASFALSVEFARQLTGNLLIYDLDLMMLYLALAVGFTLLVGARGGFLIGSATSKYTKLMDTIEPKRKEKRTEPNFSVTGRRYTLALIASIVVFVVAVAPRLSQPLSGDEVHQFNTAVGFLKTGTFWQWNFIDQEPFISYERGWPSTMAMVVSMKTFGINEAAARLPSVIFGIGSIILTYLLARLVTASRIVALLAALFLAVHPWFIWDGSYARVYGSFLFFSLGYYYLIVRMVMDQRITFFRSLIAFALFTAAIINQLIFVSILPFTFIAILFIIVKRFGRTYRRRLVVWLIVLGFVTTLGTLVMPTISENLFAYKGYLRTIHQPLIGLNGASIISFFDFPFWFAAAIIMAVAIFFIPASRRKQGFYLLFVLFVTVHFFYAFASAETHPRYITHLIPVNFILLIYALYLLGQALIANRRLVSVLLGVLLLSLNFYFGTTATITNSGVVYSNSYNWRALYTCCPGATDYENYNVVIPKIAEVYEPSMLVIGHGIHLRSYYFQKVFPRRFRYIQLTKNPGNFEYRNIAGGDRDLTIADIIDLTSANDQGLFIWPNRKDEHIAAGVKVFVARNFRQLSGNGIDNSNVDVYQW